MPVTVEDSIFDILPTSTYNIKIARNAPKITFQSANGYKHQREQYSYARHSYDVEFIVTQEKWNTLENWLDQVGSNTFWYLPPESMWKSPTAPAIRLCRIPTDSIDTTVLRSSAPGNAPLYSVKFRMEEV